jgi:transcriptional regulator with XRE-family HTH domain
MKNTDARNILVVPSIFVKNDASMSVAMNEQGQYTPTVGDYIRIERIKRNWNQTELGARVGVSQKTISDLETANNEAGNLELLGKLSHELNLDFEDLVIAARLAKSREGAKRLIHALPPPTDDTEDLRAQAKALIDKIPGKHLEHTIATLKIIARSR